VSDQEWRGPILVFPDHTVAWAVTGLSDLSLQSLEAVCKAAPRIELLLIGTGARMALLPKALKAALREAGIAADTMDSGAACRTYNVLMGEERRVAAALLPMD
jgi:uncharacterized protein